MTSRLNESSGSSCYSRSDTRSNMVTMTTQVEEEGCPVIEESGTVCGETKTLSIFQEFRQIYDDCLRKMEANKDDTSTLRKLAPFRKLVEDLWKQNAMLVETVEELEQEATCRVAMLQNKLDQCNEKVNEYLEDIDSLVEVIRRFREKGVLDSSGLKFNTVCDLEIHGYCKSSCNMPQEAINNEQKCDKKGEEESRKSQLRDTSTDMADYLKSPKTTPIVSRNPSFHSNLTAESVISEIYEKYESKTSEFRKRMDKLLKCKCSEPKLNCACLGLSKTDSASGGDKSVENVVNTEKCSPSSEKPSQPASDLNSSKIEETGRNVESFHSAVDCMRKQVESKDEKDQNTKITVIKQKCDKISLETVPEYTPPAAAVSFQPKSAACSSCAKNKYRDGYPDYPRPININLNLIRETGCFDKGFSDCDCDCNVCGCSYCDR